MSWWTTRRQRQEALLQERVRKIEQAQTALEERLRRHQERLDALTAAMPVPPPREFGAAGPPAAEG